MSKIPNCFRHKDGIYPPKKDQQMAWDNMEEKKKDEYMELFYKVEAPGSDMRGGFNDLINDIEQMTATYNAQTELKL